jgi:hypothetical protein
VTQFKGRLGIACVFDPDEFLGLLIHVPKPGHFGTVPPGVPWRVYWALARSPFGRLAD